MGLRSSLQSRLRPFFLRFGDWVRGSRFLRRASLRLLREFPGVSARVKMYYWLAKQGSETLPPAQNPAAESAAARASPGGGATQIQKPRLDGLGDTLRTPLERWYWDYSDR